MELKDLALLCSCPLFRGVDPRSLAPAFSPRELEPRRFASGSVVLLAGCRYSALHVLLQGEAYAEMTSDEGKIVRVESFSPVEAIAAAILFSPDQRLPVTLTARTDCRFVVLPKPLLLELCRSQPAVLEALLAELGRRLDSLADKLRAAQFSGLGERLADWLLRRASLSGSQTVRVEAGRERMAELFGVARPSLSRELSRLRKAGVLDFSGKEISILDQAALTRIRNGSSPNAGRRSGR